jgi:long-chain acyl-CoA synthetase
LNVVPIEREEVSLAGLRRVRSILSQGEPILIFPEGTRSRNGELQEFKPGVGLIAMEMNVPVIPTFIDGTYEALPAGRTMPRRSRIRVSFSKPILMDAYKGDESEWGKDEVYRAIAGDIRAAVEALSNKKTN